MARKKDTLTLSVPPGSKERLEALAEQLGIFWGKTPSPSGLIAAIANGDLSVGSSFQLTTPQVVALRQSTKLLVDAGQIGDAQTIFNLMLERADLAPPIRQALLEQVGEPTQAWRMVINRHIRDRDPFRILYASSQGDALEYLARYAQIAFYEKRFYLEIWCDDSFPGSSDFPELANNRCLRLDRIRAIVAAPDAQWRSQGLDTINVQLHFSGRLVRAYEPRPNDLSDEIHNGVRQVLRQIVSPFWTAREVLRYGKHCIAIGPPAFRQHIQSEIRELYEAYDVPPNPQP